MKNFNLVLVLIICICTFSSCRKLITEDFPDFDPKPTVNAIIRDGESIMVHVSLAKKIDSIPLSGVENAVVRLFVDNVLVDDLESVGDGFYESEFLGEQGKLYALEVTIPDFETVRSQTFLPHSEFIRSIQHINDAGRDEDGLSIPALRITFTNNPNQRQYFQLSVRTYQEGFVDYWGNIIPDYMDPVAVLNISDPVLLGEGLPILVFSNRMITDTIYTMYLEYTTGSASSSGSGWQMTLYPLIVELRSIDESYYHYLRSVFLYERNIFSSNIGEIYPPVPLHSNVQGGFGIVTSFSRHTYDIIYPTR
jgi:hypothetical protein